MLGRHSFWPHRETCFEFLDEKRAVCLRHDRLLTEYRACGMARPVKDSFDGIAPHVP